MDSPTGAPAQAAETSAPPPSSGFDLNEFRRSKSETPTQDTPSPASQVDETPDPDIEGDPELRAEVDKIEAPKENETPAEKAARTKRHKQAAVKGYQTRLQNKIARLEGQLAEATRRQQPPAGPQHQPRTDAPPAARSPETDPRDPEPDFDSWAAKNPFDPAKYGNSPDPYARWQAEFSKEWNRWDRRQEQRQQERTRREHESRQSAERTRAELQQRSEAARAQHRDFDDVIESLDLALANHPANEAIADYIANVADPKVAGLMAYQLGKDLAATKRAIEGGPKRLNAYLGVVEHALSAAAVRPAAPPITAAPAPHTPVAAASTGNSFSVGPSGQVDIRAYRKAKAAGRLPAELR